MKQRSSLEAIRCGLLAMALLVLLVARAGLALAALAGHLADAGVLFPAALTDDEAVKIGVDAAGTMPSDRSEIALCVREGLEKMARGTP